MKKEAKEFRWVHVSKLWAKQIRIKKESQKVFVPKSILRKGGECQCLVI
jgi:hypothetical protein